MHRVSEGLTPEPLPDPDLELALVVTHERSGRATLEYEVPAPAMVFLAS